MTIAIELTRDGRVIDGYETWWDEVESVLGQSSLDLPVLRRIDPYGDVRIQGDDLARMARELEALIPTSVPREVIDRITALCVEAQRDIGNSYLLFRGD